MKIPPDYAVNAEMLSLISKIEALKIFFSSTILPINIKQKIQRVSLLKSSLFSARIEGNPLQLSDLEKNLGDKKKKLEIFSILKAINRINNLKRGLIQKDLLLSLHKLTLKNLSPDAGKLRKEASAIFNSAGIAVYLTPPPAKVSELLDNLLIFINSDKEQFPLIKALLAHLIFEKIHPFLDGNGRVGRVLISAVLAAKEWNFNMVVPFEEFLDEHKEEYYFHLDNGLKETEEYLIFMLGAFLSQLEKIKIQIDEELTKNKNLFLPPRQEEIFNLIKDHSVLSFDVIRRRFLNVPERTLRYDLKKLVDKGLVEKGGETKGRYYRVM